MISKVLFSFDRIEQMNTAFGYIQYKLTPNHFSHTNLCVILYLWNITLAYPKTVNIKMAR